MFRRLRDQSPTRSCAGFTLIEVLVALTLLAVGLTAVIELFSGSLSLIRSSRVYTTATFLANQKMGEALVSKDELSQSGDFDYPYDNFSYVVEDGSGGEDSWHVEVFDEILSIISKREESISLPALVKIRVIVSWEENHRERTLKLETLQARIREYEAE